MRVLIDTSYAGRGTSGTSVYLDRLVAALRAEGRVEVVTAAQRARAARGGGQGLRGLVRSAFNALSDAAWLHAGLPRAARRAGADVVHHPLPAHSRRIGVPQVCTVHDVAFLRHPEGYGSAWRLLAGRAYRRAVRRCAAVVCPTEAAARDCAALLGADPRRTVVAQHGPGQAEGAERAAPGSTGPLLYVGDAQERKNLSGLLAAYAAYRSRVEEPVGLVLAGGSASVARGEGVSGRAAPSEAELIEVLRGALALVHPSRDEGFGLTPLEAMALGVPVLAVRNPGTEEVCGDAALLVGPGELVSGLVRVTSDAALREDLAARGRRRADDFSWAASARRHEHAYTLAHGLEAPATP